MSKYRAKKTIVDGIAFDSKRESVRWQELCLLEKAGEITSLRRQVEFLLIPEQREPDTIGARGGVKKGKVLERKCTYVADFTYYENGELVVEDVKGIRTDVYKLKRKLFLQMWGIRIRET